mmetsp:Transcript_23765/g.36668  ORF Transcript_23765/g.36668 Transcript_23765/m.36668 type:complete len:496 (-) Transcript_23765:94-1581(-)|eukprot:CAMPEP_0196805006 /NCGR_PEP_ID=MMETSP1362-20130617/4712_1 /TAXON_ID=163516 /ORGANISM="Leptocylindrus danicus, Strain CCMP1856" /LENGTH=495 /DNA_ID=CAMNT_0042177641 /DNA_START=347 /DNA_END=1834 /DNA_ORIENTATION=-
MEQGYNNGTPEHTTTITWENVLNLTAAGTKLGNLTLTDTHLKFSQEFDRSCEAEQALPSTTYIEDNDDMGYILTPGKQSNNSKGFMWSLMGIAEIYPRCFRSKDCAMELFGPSGHAGKYGKYVLSDISLYLAFDSAENGKQSGSNVAREVVDAIKERANHVKIKYWPTHNISSFLTSLVKYDPLEKLARQWRKHRISNYDYLMKLNSIAGRSRHDLSRYPVMPWVLSNYTSKEIDLNDVNNYRDLSKPMGALCSERLERFRDKYKALKKDNDSNIPPFMYGSHYSSKGGVVLHFLIRLRPFTGLHRKLQGGKFDVADRLFDSIPRAWDISSKESLSEVKELTFEFYSNPDFLANKHNFKLGTNFDGKIVSDVELPPWADGSPEKFVRIMREALESDICSAMLPSWIDLVFGFKQRGKEAVRSDNLFHYLSYYGPEDVKQIKDVDARELVELHLDDFGNCPAQIFYKQHKKKKKLDFVDPPLHDNDGEDDEDFEEV